MGTIVLLASVAKASAITGRKISRVSMNKLIIISLLLAMIATVTQGRPRYVLVPIDEFYPYEQSYEQPQIIAEPSQIMPIYRAKRSVGPYEEKEQSKRAAGYSEHGHGHAHD